METIRAGQADGGNRFGFVSRKHFGKGNHSGRSAAVLAFIPERSIRFIAANRAGAVRWLPNPWLSNR